MVLSGANKLKKSMDKRRRDGEIERERECALGSVRDTTTHNITVVWWKKNHIVMISKRQQNEGKYTVSTQNSWML